MQLGYADQTERSIKLNATLAKAVATLTSDATNPADVGTLTLDTRVYTYKDTLTAAVASAGEIESDNELATVGSQVVVGSLTYKIVAALSTIAPSTHIEVLNGVSADATLLNLKNAINEDLATFGTTYSKNARQNIVIAGNVTAHAIAITARTAGTAGDAIVLTSDDPSYTVTAMTGGVDTVANQIKIGASAAATLDNTKDAVNGTGTIGTQYSLGTVAHETIEATTNSDTTQVFSARTGGVAGNSLAMSENATHLSMGSVAGGGGTVGSQVVGIGCGGMIHRIISKAPQFTGTPTYTISIQSAAGSALYTTGALNENAVTDTAKEMVLADTDVIVVTANATAEDTLPILVSFR
jgi:hypothetical protein